MLYHSIKIRRTVITTEMYFIPVVQKKIGNFVKKLILLLLFVFYDKVFSRQILSLLQKQINNFFGVSIILYPQVF